MPFLICGLDEVGRGALAGPLMAVASLFSAPNTDPASWETCWTPIPGVNDSKKLPHKKREEVFRRLLRHELLLDFGIGEASVEEINRHGIEWANRVVFERAVKDLRWMPNFVLVDGDEPLYGWNMMDQRFEPKGDALWWPVGAASILAKVIRDSYMDELAKDFELYGWDRNAGYGSEEHRAALLNFGSCIHHRKQFISRLVGRTP